MREYGIVSPQFWIGATGKKIRGDSNAQMIALYLMTSPHSHMTGVFHCPVLYMSYETGVPLEGASKGLQRLIEVGFCEYDEPSETVFVIKMAAYQIGDSLKHGDNRIVGLKKELAKMPETPMKSRFIEIYNEPFCLEMEVKNPIFFEAPLKPLRSQEQEQEQDQDQENTHTPTTVPNSNQAQPEPTPAARVCRELRNLGFGETNPAHPLLLELLNAGAIVDEFVYAGKEAKKKGKDFKYILGIVKGQRAEALAASKQILHGDVPNKSPPKTTPQRENFHEKDYGEIRNL